MSTTFNFTLGAKIFDPEFAPVLEVNPITMYHVQGKDYQEYGVLCYHHHKGNSIDRRLLTPTMSPTINSSTPVGTYNITYTITNGKGTATASRILIVVKRPIITRLGDASITRYVGEPLNDPGYIIDNKGVMIVPEVILLNNPPTDVYGNLKTANTYDVIYSMSYGAQFPSFTQREFKREIIIKNKKPTITVNPTVVYWKQGVTYDDNVAGVSGSPVTTDTSSLITDPSNLSHSIYGSVNTKKDIIYTALQTNGESVTATRVVRFIQQPTLTLKGSTTMNVQTRDIWVDPGYTATDAFGVTSYEVGITGVPVLDLENRMVTPGTYTVSYTLRVSNTPSTQITSVVVETRTVIVSNPSNPPVLKVSPKRVYHRHLDAYADTGVSAETYQGATINAGNSVGTLRTTSITRNYDRNSTTIANIGDIGLLIGEYTITYEVTHNGVTVKDTRYVDVYSDLLDSKNFYTTPDGGSETTTAIRATAGVKIESHNFVSSINVHTLPGTSSKQRIRIDQTKAPCDTFKPFTFMTWVRVKSGQTTGTIILLMTTDIKILLEIKLNIADYFNGGDQSTRVKASLYGQIWGDSYLKELDTDGLQYTAYPYMFRDGGRRVYTSMHDCPRLDEWLWVSVQYDGYHTYILSINGTRFEHNTLYKNKIAGITGVTVADSQGGAQMQFDICNTRFIYRFLHIHEIQALYEDFVLNNTDLIPKYNEFDTQLEVVKAYITTFKAGTNSGTDDTNFESALRKIRIIGHCAFQKEDGSHLQKALDIIKKFETDHGPLFVGPSNDYWDTKVGIAKSLYQLQTGYYGFAPYQQSDAQDPSKQLNTHRLARGMLFFQHIVWDAGLQACSPYRHFFVSSEYPISFASSLRTKKLQDVAETAKWGTATYIKGQTANVTAPAEELSIKLKIRNRPVKGIKGDFFSVSQIRCTGMWVNNGVVAEVTVPEIIVNKGIQICIGANMNDPSLLETGHGGGKHGRMDRCSTFFLIDRSTVRVYNPLGGNIYVLVPYGVDIGMITLTAKNVVRSRMFRMINDDITGFQHTTSDAEWNAALPMVDAQDPKVTLATAGSPTVDIETDYMLLHIPSQWIEQNVYRDKWLTEISGTSTIYNRIKDLAMKYNSICKSIMIFRGMIGGIDAVGAIDHPMFYTSVDMVVRTTGGGVGWPMVNGPLISDQSSNKHVMNWCVDATVNLHELGHMYCNRALAFSNEGETANIFMTVFILNQTCGIDLNSAYRYDDTSENTMGLDEAVVDWMKEDAFVNGKYMSYYYAGYQKRSWHKYADIVALVGWDGLYAYQRVENEVWEDNLKLSTPKTFNTLCTDTNRIVRMTLALGIDIFPLLEFWGITDETSGKETTFRTSVRTIIETTLMGKKSSYFKAYGSPDLQQTCVVHKCRGIRTLLLYFKSLIPKTNKDAIDHVCKSWRQAFPVSSGSETLKMTNAEPTDKYLGWWEKFFITDNKKWDSTKISAIETRIDAILAAHGLTNEPAAVTGCIACANNKPNFNPTPKMDSSWAITPTYNRIYTIPYIDLTFYITEDALGFIVKGDRDHNGLLPVGEKIPILNVRIGTKLLFYVSTVTPFYIMNELQQQAQASAKVKNQGITKGLLIWNHETSEDFYYGKLGGEIGKYKNKIKRVFGSENPIRN